MESDKLAKYLTQSQLTCYQSSYQFHMQHQVVMQWVNFNAIEINVSSLCVHVQTNLNTYRKRLSHTNNG